MSDGLAVGLSVRILTAYNRLDGWGWRLDERRGGEVKLVSAGLTGGGELSPVGVTAQVLLLLLSVSLWPFCSFATVVIDAPELRTSC